MPCAQPCQRVASFVLAACVLLNVTPALANVVVLTNRTPRAIEARIKPSDAPAYGVQILSGDVRPLFADNGLRIEFAANDERKNYPLEANSVYFFGETRSGRLDLQKIGLGGTPETMAGRPLPGDAQRLGPATVSVKLLVDEEQALRRDVWERQLRSRVAKASDILYRHSGVRLRVVAIDTWQSENTTRSFFKSLAEFEQAVDPRPARLAIGFTSQYEATRGRTHLGGIRGPLRKHLMIREWSQVVSESEKLELLVHELGHFLGATHSPEPDSVMRPVLGDRQSRLAGFKIRFDAVNTLIMSMVGEEMRRGGASQFTQFTPGTRARLRQVYKSLEKAIPGDKSAAQFLALTSRPTSGASLAAQTRRVLGAITATAEANHRRPEIDRYDGDLLTEQYVRAAAAEAAKLPEKIGPQAFLLAIAMGVGDAGAIQRGLQNKKLQSIENAEQRGRRLRVLGRPTALGRRDLAQHFTVSAGLTAGLGPDEAFTLGYAKEAIDAQPGGSGFSFVDLAADRAGVRFAQRVLVGKFRLATIAQYFRVEHYLPATAGLEEGLSSRDVVRRFGGKGDERFDKVVAEIDARLDVLPPYFVTR